MKLTKFCVTNFRNIHDSGWVEVEDLTALVGQNESGKSNLCEALWKLSPSDNASKYNVDEDWPADRWEEKSDTVVVCQAHFTETDPAAIDHLMTVAALAAGTPRPESFTIVASRNYRNELVVSVEDPDNLLDATKARAWATEKLPKCVYIRDYDLSGHQTELPQLRDRRNQVGANWNQLTNDEQTMLIILELAKINLDEFIARGNDATGRTLRSFDKRSASAYLTKQFGRLWRQKKVSFDIEVDASTLNIFVVDEGVGMPVRLSMRSTGFRWYVSFAWKFTHATKGQYKDCILLLEEPGVHLHHSGHADLIDLFEELSKSNTIIYTTHLATMLDPSYPERIRIVEVHNHHSHVLNGMVSQQRQPMMVIEATLGLTGSMAGLLGNRQTLIVEGGDDAIILQKLSGLLQSNGKEGLSNRIYLFPARGASKTPMYAAFMVGQKWDAGVLLDSDAAGAEAKKKITELYLKELGDGQVFHVFMLGTVAGISKTDSAIEDLFPDDFYLECVNEAYGTAIKIEHLPQDGSTLIADRVEHVLKKNHGRSSLDTMRVLSVILKRLDGAKKLDDLPAVLIERAEKLFKAINTKFAKKKGG